MNDISRVDLRRQIDSMNQFELTFRQWLQQRWYDHCAEIEGWTGRMPDYPMQEYFARYKHWLRREYRHQKGAK